MCWYESLPENTRETLFAWMRATDTEYQSQLDRSYALQAPHGTLAVGAGAFDPFLRAEALRLYLTALRTGAEPSEALEHAKTGARESIRIHNAKRPADINWQRSETMADGRLESLHRSLLAALKEA